MEKLFIANFETLPQALGDFLRAYNADVVLLK